jgi:hypothetical protein
MAANKIGAALLAVVALAGCSPKPSAANSAPSAAGPVGDPGSASAAVTIAIPAHQAVVKKLTLPPGTHKLGVKTGAASFSCDHMAFVADDGERSNNFTDAQVPANLNMTDSTNSGTYASVDLQCQGGAADSELVLTPSP